jgi:hypothetical protein
MFPTGEIINKSKHFEHVPTDMLETFSLVPRTNKRKIRKYLVVHVGIAPSMVKRAMRDLDLIEIPRKNLAVMREWIKWNATEVPAKDIRTAARMIKASPASRLGVLCGKTRHELRARGEFY